MKDEFDYGMQKMGAEYDYQSKFATDEANRENNKLSLMGDIQQNQTGLVKDRLNIATQGKWDINKINAQVRSIKISRHEGGKP